MFKEIGFIAGSCVCALVIRQIVEYRKALREIREFPGFRLLLPSNGIANFLPKIPLVSLEREFTWVHKYRDCVQFGWDAFSFVSFWPVSVTIFTSDPDMIKEITASRSLFPKPLEMYQVLAFYGKNLLVTEGQDWVSHRKISAPAFSEKNLRLVWRESVRLVEEVFEDWGQEGVVKVDSVTDLTVQLALLVIGGAGFGHQTSWKDKAAIPLGSNHLMSFREALAIVARDVWFKILIPGWMWGSVVDRETLAVSGIAGKGWLGKRVQQAAVAYSELRTYMVEMIASRQESGPMEDTFDLFTGLLRAAEAEKGADGSLSEEEVIGNIFIYLIAGHESTAHSVAFAIGLLGLYPLEQEKVYESTKKVLANGRQPLYEDIPALPHVLAVFYEAMRIYPAVTSIPKVADQGAVLPVRSSVTSEESDNFTIRNVVIPPGSRIMIDVPGLHYNPRYWENPWAFEPERFLKDWPKDAFMPFSTGPRSCIGRKFSETEAVAVLVMVITRYQIVVDEERFKTIPGETPEERRERFMPVSPGITLKPADIPVKFVRRAPQ